MCDSATPPIPVPVPVMPSVGPVRTAVLIERYRIGCGPTQANDRVNRYGVADIWPRSIVTVGTPWKHHDHDRCRCRYLQHRPTSDCSENAAHVNVRPVGNVSVE